jgi:hypothetical protein
VLGLLDAQGRWLLSIEIQPSTFIAAVEVPTDGDYQVGVANNLPGNLSVNDVEVNEIGFMALGSAAAGPMQR